MLPCNHFIFSLLVARCFKVSDPSNNLYCPVLNYSRKRPASMLLVKESANIACELIHRREIFSCNRSRIKRRSIRVRCLLHAGGAVLVETSKTDLQSVTALQWGALFSTSLGSAQLMLGSSSHSHTILKKHPVWR